MADVVVDASIAMKWVVAEEGGNDVRALLQSWLTCEVANILHRKTLSGDLSFTDALDAYDDLLLFVITLSIAHTLRYPKRTAPGVTSE